MRNSSNSSPLFDFFFLMTIMDHSVDKNPKVRCTVMLISLIVNLKHKMVLYGNDFVHEVLPFIINRQSIRIKV